MQIQAIKTRVFKEGEDLVKFIQLHIPKIKESTVIVVTSKIVALSQGRTVWKKDEQTRDKIIKSESQWAIKTKYTWLTIKDNMVVASAGIDESNGNGKIILLPKDSFKAAQTIREKLRKIYKLKNLGVIISDSRLLPLRAGIVGVAVGYAGFKGVKDDRGKKDIFGRVLKLSRTDLADGLATSAVMLMGEGAEKQPLCIITNAPVQYADKINKKELEIDIKEDIYQPLFEKIKKIRWRDK